MRIKSISGPVSVEFEPTASGILMVPMTVLNNTPHRIHTSIAISSRRNLEIARERDGVRGRITCRRVGAETVTDLVVDLLVRECPVCRRDK